jgi:hypothetical protein
LKIGPGIGNRAPGRSGVAKGVAEVRKLVGDAVGLEIGDVKAGKINAPFFEIAADHFGLVAVMVILVLLACEERGGQKQREQQAGKQNRKHAAGYTRGKTDFHRNHLGTANTNAATIDLYSSRGQGAYSARRLSPAKTRRWPRISMSRFTASLLLFLTR